MSGVTRGRGGRALAGRASMSTSETVKAWPSAIADVTQIPPPFRAAFEAARLGTSPFPLALYSPAFRFDRFESPEQLLALEPERAVAFEVRHGRVAARELALAGLESVDYGIELLHGWLQLDGGGEEGPASLRIDFHTAGRDLFRPVVDDLRRRWYAGAHTDHASELAKLDPLVRVDFKLMTYGRDCLLDGVDVRRFHLQPRITKGEGAAAATVVPASLALLTGRELVLIREGDEVAEGIYAGAWRHVRLDRVTRVEIRVWGATLELRATLDCGAVATCAYAPEGESALRAFAAEVSKAAPAIARRESELRI